MNFDLETEKLLDILSSHPWDSGMGRKILFLKRRYYVFDNMHKLLDGGVIRYNQTLDKIFIRNEDLRGELFITRNEYGRIRVKGSVLSKLAGLIKIDNLLSRYDKALKAPLSRVAKVEKYLSPSDIYKILNTQEEIDPFFLKNFSKHLLFFSPLQARQLYIKLSQNYFKNYERRVLEHTSLYFSLYPLNEQLYEELFMFIMAIQSANENESIKKEDTDYFISSVKKRLTDAYKQGPSTISINLINETLLYFGLDSPYLPDPQKCIKKLYDKDLSVQKEYAYYLVLMLERVKEVEDDIYKRLTEFYQESFFEFLHKLKETEYIHLKKKRIVTGLNTLLALIEALGNCKSGNRDVHLFFIFLLSNAENRIRESARRALLSCRDKLTPTLQDLHYSEARLQDEVMEIINKRLQ